MSRYFATALIIFAIAAQTSALTLSSPTDLVLQSSSLSPKAGANFTVEAKSFAFDPARADFQWFLNGKLIASGKGLRAETFTASSLGSIMNVRVTAVSEEGIGYEARLALPINDIDLVVRPLTYVPTFYRGSPLPTPGSLVEITALPHLYSQNTKLNPQNLIYEWKVDNTFLGNESGGGKNKLLLQLADVGSGSYLVSVKVSASAGEMPVERSVRVRTVSPQILFYKTNSLTGIRPFAFSSLNIFAGEKIAISAEPYFFDLASLAKAAFSWLADGAPLTDVQNPRLLELESPAGSDSQGIFNLKIEDKSTIFQSAEANLSITSSL